MSAWLEVLDATIAAPGGRLLFDGLTLRLSREHVALIGRNGVGKSTLLSVLAGAADVQRGRVTARRPPLLVPQALSAEALGDPPGRPLSRGELRRRALDAARASGAEILLLDEPTEDLDEASVEWLRGWLRAWSGGAVVVSHDRRLLADFRHFFVASESGCRYEQGTLDDVEARLEREHEAAERRHVRGLHQLASAEERTLHIARRKARKKRYGRCSELDRNTPRVRLNQKRDQAQDSHGKLAKVREARLAAVRDLSLAMRRAMRVSLSLDLPVPALPAAAGDVAVLRGVSAIAGERRLFGPLDLRVGRRRIGVVGPSGAGKTTLLDILLGRRAPAAGTASREASRIGAIAQGGDDWRLDESLLDLLATGGGTSAEWASALVGHRFPLALAERPLASLSAGERARAALIALFRRAPPVELLVLDEPTYSLDLVGARSMTRALRAWPGGLVVASHDREFLAAIGVDELVHLSP